MLDYLCIRPPRLFGGTFEQTSKDRGFKPKNPSMAMNIMYIHAKIFVNIFLNIH